MRTRLPAVPTSPLEYLRGVQSQHISSTTMDNENMQWSDIVQNCTSWPVWTRFATVVQHQDQGELDALNTFTIGSASCRMNCIEFNHQNTDIFVRSSTSGSSNVSISLTFSEKRIQPPLVQEILSMLCSTISLLTSAFIMEPISLRGLHHSSGTPKTPFPATRRGPATSSPVAPVLPDHAGAIHAVISAGWDTILGAGTLEMAQDIRTVPFYEFTSSLLPAAELARYYTDSMPRLHIPGLAQATFTLDDILENSTMMKQYEMIIGRQQAPALKRSQSFVHTVKRRLTVNAGPGPVSPATGHSPGRCGGSNSGSSLETMTSGSSNSDEDEQDTVAPLTPISPRRRGGMKTLEVKRRSSILLGKMKKGSGSVGT